MVVVATVGPTPQIHRLCTTAPTLDKGLVRASHQGHVKYPLRLSLGALSSLLRWVEFLVTVSVFVLLASRRTPRPLPGST